MRLSATSCFFSLPVVGRAARAEGGGGDKAGVEDAVVLEAVHVVGEEAEHGGRAVALGEPAAVAWSGDDAAPPSAHGGGADEAHGVIRRQAEEALLDELVHQRLVGRHAACLARHGGAPRRRRRRT
ncbi:hypothetical protein PVAP13_3KG507401 [Panicum virgatum]|uniref:Uncharacterized protein n=1 Tax=Panicum virgatum TaxID=38727 RepID=A0A8T0V940_PANVG|nr:hypothetical protein PVAP13_3KG507401 [Panicum virgatum]